MFCERENHLRLSIPHIIAPGIVSARPTGKRSIPTNAFGSDEVVFTLVAVLVVLQVEVPIKIAPTAIVPNPTEVRTIPVVFLLPP